MRRHGHGWFSVSFASLVASLVGVVGVVGAACDKGAPAPQGREAPHGLPALEGGVGATGGGPASMPAAGPGMANPHGGALPPGHPPIDQAGGDPAAAAGAPGAANPHAAPAQADPNAILDGAIDVAAALKDQVKPGDIIFLSAKPIDAAGQVQRMPVAAIRLDVARLPITFHLGGENAMMGGELKGTVMLIARVDRDGEAMTRKPGDIEGTVKTTVPAKDLKIVLDTPVDR